MRMKKFSDVGYASYMLIGFVAAFLFWVVYNYNSQDVPLPPPPSKIEIDVR